MVSVSDDAGARLERALETFLLRESRSESPAGAWQGGVWRPAAEEQRACCDAIALTPANKQALEAHCRTIVHVAALFEVPATNLKRAVRAARAPARPGPDARKPYAERFFEASSTAREEAYAALRSEAKRFALVQQRVLSIGREEPDALAALLETAGVGLERYILALQFATEVEAAYRFATSALAKFRSMGRFGFDGDSDESFEKTPSNDQ